VSFRPRPFDDWKRETPSWPDFTDVIIMPGVLRASLSPSLSHKTSTEVQMAQAEALAKMQKIEEALFLGTGTHNEKKEKPKMPLPPEDQGKPGDPPNLGLLIKLLKMTTSSNDAEALSAIRKANEQLIKFGNDWEPLLRGKVTVIGDPFLNAAINPSVGKRTPPPPAAPSSPYQQPRSRPAPPPPPPPPPPPKSTSNKFGGYCHHCNNYVPEHDGIVTLVSSKWILSCTSCSSNPSAKRSAKRAATPLDNL